MSQHSRTRHVGIPLGISRSCHTPTTRVVRRFFWLIGVALATVMVGARPAAAQQLVECSSSQGGWTRCYNILASVNAKGTVTITDTWQKPSTASAGAFTCNVTSGPIASCSPSPRTFTSGSGSQTVTVTITGGTTGGSGTIRLIANTFSIQTYVDITVSIRMPQVSALPVGLADGATLVLLAQTGKTQKFAIQNTGPLSTQFNYYAGCSGAASCAVTSVSKTTSTLAASGRDTVTVTYDVSGSQAVNGVVKLFAKYTADTSFVKDSGWVNVVTPSPTLVTPDAGTASPAAGLGSSQTFLVKNTGPLPMSLRLAPVCTGVGLVTGRCASSVDGLFLNGGDSTLVTVAYQPVTGGGAGRIVLRATEVITSTLLDSGYVNVNAPVPPLAIVEVPEARAGATIEKDNCLVFALRVEVAAECGVLRVTHSLPAVRTMNKARVPTLIYYYDQAILINVFGVNVTLPASTPTVFSD